MSHPSNSEIFDYIKDNEPEMVDRYMENERAWEDFEGWLFSEENKVIRQIVFSYFMRKDKESAQRFYEWAYDTVVNDRGEP